MRLWNLSYERARELLWHLEKGNVERFKELFDDIYQEADDRINFDVFPTAFYEKEIKKHTSILTMLHVALGQHSFETFGLLVRDDRFPWWITDEMFQYLHETDDLPSLRAFFQALDFIRYCKIGDQNNHFYREEVLSFISEHERMIACLEKEKKKIRLLELFHLN